MTTEAGLEISMGSSSSIDDEVVPATRAAKARHPIPDRPRSSASRTPLEPDEPDEPIDPTGREPRLQRRAGVTIADGHRSMNAFDYFLEESGSLDKDFIVGSTGISFRELEERSLRLAAWLRSEIGERKNVVILLPNSVRFIVAYLAVLKSGNTCVPLAIDIEKSSLDHIIAQTRCDSFFVTCRRSAWIEDSTSLIVDEAALDRLLDDGPAPVETDESFDDQRLASIIFTSGSTGEPKGVMLSHRNLISNTSSIVEYLELTSDDRILAVLPFSYCYGLSLLHTHLRVGASMVLNDRFVFTGRIIADLLDWECTEFAGVPSHFQILLRKTKSFKETEFPALKRVTQAGGELHDAFITEFVESFPDVAFHVMYGQTEATARLAHLPPARLADKLGSIGRAIPGVTLEVVDDQGLPRRAGEVGELVARGDNVMRGYLGDPEATGRTIRDGWLHTGDLATKDEEGFIFLVGRMKEMIKTGGRRINPKEVEAVIVAMPEVVDASVEGVDDDILGEAIRAIVCVRGFSDHSLTPKEVREFCAKKLSRFKVPHIVELRERLDIGPNGKRSRPSPRARS